MRNTKATRRSFLMHSAATVSTTSALVGVDAARTAYAGGTDVLKIGLVGCGGRGTGAAEQALTADSNTKLVAMGDAFGDQIESSLSTLKASAVAEQVDVPADHRFTGFDAYKAVIDAADVVLLATPPGFRPIHFSYAVEKGKHAFVEKPMAVDGPGLRQFLTAAKASKEKGLCAAHGFCWRYYGPRRELIKRVHGGDIGDVLAVESTYNSQGVWDPRKAREECKNEMEYQMRNWYYYDWLSGDHIVEQAVHSLDTMSWILKDVRPERCWGVGGRQARTNPKYGNIWDHFSVVYEFPENVRAYHHCRHWPNTPERVKDYALGTRGMADVFGPRITGANKWSGRGGREDMYQNEHNELFAALRAGQQLNNVEQAAGSSLLAIMGRMAAYTGEVITWDQALGSTTSLVPTEFAWGDAPVRPVPVPGITKFA